MNPPTPVVDYVTAYCSAWLEYKTRRLAVDASVRRVVLAFALVIPAELGNWNGFDFFILHDVVHVGYTHQEVRSWGVATRHLAYVAFPAAWLLESLDEADLVAKIRALLAEKSDTVTVVTKIRAAPPPEPADGEEGP